MNLVRLCMPVAVAGVAMSLAAMGCAWLSPEACGKPMLALDRPGPARSSMPSVRPVPQSTVDTAASAAVVAAPSPTSADISGWLAAARGTDAQARVDAIWNLGSAPRDVALPALRQAAREGSAEDRDVALEALVSLARSHGDDDDAIRTAVRETIYHGDDDDVLFTARATLDDIESVIARR